MKLYYAPGTCAVACWVALEWAGADYEAVRADYASAEFQRINPMSMVPALDIGGARAMTQANAILTYIADTHPEANLGPDADEQGRFEFNETMAFLTGDFHPAFWPFFSPQRFTVDTSQQALDNVGLASHARIDRVLQHLDRLIGSGDHVYRNRRTVADAYAYIMCRWTAKLPKSWKDYPNVARFFDRMKADEAVQSVLRQSVA